ncbi:hypothetical protein Q8F55_003041 [Vanrija albida]|uniref:TPX2 C-terminal domain-containing protein n=1 Tax=Vanrija albida TaxID=181172 RepID=A0ABR3QBD9_9TREE
MATVGIDYSLPRPVDLDRWPSNPPSLSHTTTTDNSDERTPGGSPNLSTPMTPPLSLKELTQAEGARAYQRLDAPDAAFNDKRSKRMSLSRSMQSLRSMAKAQADKARKRASTISEREFLAAPASTTVTPPPVELKPEAKGFKALFSRFKGKKAKPEPALPTPAPAPAFRDESSGELPKTKAEIKAEEKAEKRRSKAAVKAAKRQSQSAAQVYATTYMTTSQRAAMALDKSLDTDQLKVEKVNAPPSVRGVLLDMQRSSAIIERRATIRRQSLQLDNKHASYVSSKTGHSVAAPTAPAARRSRRVPVPSFEPDESEPMPMPGDRPAPMDLEVSPEAAAAARAAALARLEGKPAQRTPVSEDEHEHILVSNLGPRSNDGHLLRAMPSLQSISEKVETRDTAPLRTKQSLRKIDTVDILSVNAAAIPLPRSPIMDRTEPATQVPDLSDIVRPKHTAALPAGASPITRGLWTTEPDEMEGAEPLLPSSVSAQRTFNTFPRSATGPTLRRTKPSLRNLHKAPFDRSADATSDETHDVVRPLEIRIAPRSATFGPCSNLNEPATPSSFEHSVSENGHASSVGCGSTVDHRSAAVRRYGSLLGYGHGGTPERNGSTATHAVPSLLGHGSSLGHGTSMTHNSFLDSAPPSPMTPRTPPESQDEEPETPSSKWRKSAQSLSRRLSTKTSSTSLRTASLSRKLSTRPKEPPTSYDAYEAKQREIATRRRSCNATVHDNASLQAKISEVRDKEEVRVAETFFLS